MAQQKLGDLRLVLAIFCVSAFLPSCDGDEAGARDSKLLNVFNIVKFPNDGCTTVSGTYGVCYTASECDTLGLGQTIMLAIFKNIFLPRGHRDGHLRQWVWSLLPVQWNLWTDDRSEQHLF